MNRRLLRSLLPFVSLAVVLAATFYVQPRTMSSMKKVSNLVRSRTTCTVQAQA
jgi:hypothetical protein